MRSTLERLGAHWTQKRQERQNAEVFGAIVRTAINQAIQEIGALATITARGQLDIGDPAVAFADIYSNHAWRLQLKVAEPSDSSVRDVAQIVRDDPVLNAEIEAKYRELIRIATNTPLAAVRAPEPAPPGRYFRPPPIPVFDDEGRRVRRKRTRRSVEVLFFLFLFVLNYLIVSHFSDRRGGGGGRGGAAETTPPPISRQLRRRPDRGRGARR